MKPPRSLLVALLALLPSQTLAAGAITIHRDPGCVCCEKWAQAVRSALGREAEITNDSTRGAFMRAACVPADLRACHTAIIDGIAFEGHVPIDDIRRVLAEHPQGVTGLAVSGMPAGSLGMEMGASRQPYDVISFGPAGRHIFAHHDS